MSERVVVKASSAPNVKCLLHQPKIDTMYASADEGDTWEEANATEIPAETVVEPLSTETNAEQQIATPRPAIDAPASNGSERPRRVKPEEVVVRSTDYSEYLQTKKPNEQ
jgi:hypothetical protein